MRDFSIPKYEEICSALVSRGYQSITLSDYFNLGGVDLTEKRVLLRHDVDRLASMALTMAEIEAEFGLKASYYFRIPHTYKSDIIKRIDALGHEVGFHYENLSKSRGNLNNAIKSFSQELDHFRKLVQVKTIAMHGNPASRFDNRDLWKSIKISDFDLLGDAHLDIDFEQVMYYSDTGRSWEEGKFNVRDKIPDGKSPINYIPQIKTSDDMIDLIGKENRNLYMVIHPERWSTSIPGWVLSWIKDTALNWGKVVFTTIYKLKSWIKAINGR